MESITDKFLRSYVELSTFLNKWTGQIQEQCVGDDQRKASFYVWFRYTISIRTLQRLCDPLYIPDILVIARACIEYSASLKGIISDPKLAADYLQFEHKAKAYYGKLLERLGDMTKIADLEQELKPIFGNNWREQADFKWANISALVELYGGPSERRAYALFSHFVHSSVIAPKVLERSIPTQRWLDLCIDTAYGSYCQSTFDFLNFAWGPVVTADSQNCKNEFTYKVMAAYV